MPSSGAISKEDATNKETLVFLVLFCGKSALRVAVVALLFLGAAHMGAMVGQATGEEAWGYRNLIMDKISLSPATQAPADPHFEPVYRVIEIIPPTDERGAVPERLQRQLNNPYLGEGAGP